MKKLLMLLVVVSVVLSGCVSVLVTPSVSNPTEVITEPLPTENPIPTEVTEVPTDVATTVPVLPPTPEIPSEHSPVTLEDVKNIKHSFEILVNEDGALIKTPEGILEEEKSLLVEYYKAIQNKFYGSKVFFNKDETTGNWVLFARLENNLFHRVVSIDGVSRFADYPIKFEPLASGSGYKVADFYNVIILQSDSIDVIWKEGIPQIVYDEVELLPDRDRYFTKYLIYDVGVNSTESNLWAEVPGVIELLASAPTPAPNDIERDLNPSYVQKVDFEYMGVGIKAELITDSSLSSRVTKVTVPNAVYAEFIARVVFRAWWRKGPEKHSDKYTEEDFKNFMSLWSTAQKSGNTEDWEKVQLNNIYANDLNDGGGYVPKAYNIWAMYEGEKPLRAVGISLISFVIVDTSSMKNIDQQSDINGISYDLGYGTNIDGGNILVYSGTDAYFNEPFYNLDLIADDMLCSSAQWLIDNSGNGLSFTYDYNDLSRLLYKGGLTVY